MLTLLSPAKINLFLRVLGKRADGFHEIASLFQTVSLYDRLSFELAEEDRLSCSDKTLPVDEHNLIIKALNLFRRHTGFKFFVRIDLEKNIPQCAGLGGGSGNAATTLWALNDLHKQPLDVAELQQLGSLLGSDVAFFFSQGTAFCTGRGEKVENLEKIPSINNFNIIKPTIGLSTKSIYDALDLTRCSCMTPEVLLESFYANMPLFINDLQEPAFRLCPSLALLKAQIEEEVQSNVFMTGSGSALISVGKGSVFPAYRTNGQWY